MLSSSDEHNLNYGYLLGKMHVIRRLLKMHMEAVDVVDAVSEIVFNERISEMLEEFNLK